MDKIVFALIVAYRKFQPNFQSHTNIVMTNQLFRKAMNKPDMVGRLIQWVVELSQFNVLYQQWIPIKAQVLANFIAEFTTTGEEDHQEGMKPHGWSKLMDHRYKAPVELESS